MAKGEAAYPPQLTTEAQEAAETSLKRVHLTERHRYDLDLPCVFHSLPELPAWRIALFVGGIKVSRLEELVDIILSFPCRCLSVVVEFDRNAYFLQQAEDEKDITDQMMKNSRNVTVLVAEALRKRSFMCLDFSLSSTDVIDEDHLMKPLVKVLLLSPQVVALALEVESRWFEYFGSRLSEAVNRAHIFRLGRYGLKIAPSQQQLAGLVGKILHQDRNLLFFDVSEVGLDLSHQTLLDINFYKSLQASRMCYLRMRESGLKTSACVAIAEVLAGHQTLQLLDLSLNSLGDRGVVAIAESLTSNTVLRFLGLTSVGISSEAGCALARALRNNESLEMCYLKDDNLGAETGKAFASMLTQNTTLKYLVMSYSDLEREGCKAFVSALKHNRTLTHLRLNYSGIARVDKPELVKAAVEGKTLKVLELEDRNELGQTSIPYEFAQIHYFHGNYRRHLLASVNNRKQ